MRTILHLLPVLLLSPLVTSFECSLTASSIPYDLSPLKGYRSAAKDTHTPPTTSEAKVELELCSPEGLKKEDGVADEDQASCPTGTKVCLRLFNRKPSSSEPDRVTAVIPFWSVDIPEGDISTSPLGKNGEQGLKLYINGPEYAGTPQHLNVTLVCSPSSTDPNPTLVSYTAGLLSLQWDTPDACPLNAENSPSGGSASGGGGGGFFKFLKLLFWLSVTGLMVYFAIGIFYNHQQYSAKGWDLVPHRDFWREVPTLMADLFSHIFAGVRGGSTGGGRGGYSSLGLQNYIFNEPPSST
ncbi:hypothetical protein IAT38_006716 [Cryptococcus sp. DSM 104549]